MRHLPWLVVGLLASSPAGLARAGEGPSSSDCLECHDDAGLKHDDGRPIAFDKKPLAASVHGQADVECVDCHQDLKTTTKFPHPSRLQPVRCAACHEKQAALYDLGVHARARQRGEGDAAACRDCHGDHDVRPKKDPDSRTNHFRLPQTCGRCHGSAEVISRAKIQVGDTFHKYEDSIHGRALSKSGLTVAPNCSDCHRAHDILRRDDPQSPVYKTRIPATCGKCHEGVERQYRDGVHGTALGKGNDKAPACTDCHSAHQIRRTDTASWRLDVLRECGTCHDNFIKSYRDTFHGQVTALGFVRTATCSDCHGAHAIFPKDDARSRVSPAHRTETCRTCHPGANQNFAAYDPHVDPHDPGRNAAIYYTARFMRLLLFSVFTFFGLHTLLWLVRGYIEHHRPSSGQA